MVKQKALPGKRYCKTCSRLIPIHCRVCRFCEAPQYTMQQITKEYKKRQKFIEDEDPFSLYHELFTQQNPFFSAIPSISISQPLNTHFQNLNTLSLEYNSHTIIIDPLDSYKDGDFFLLNPCSKTNNLAFSYGIPNYLCLSLCNDDILFGRKYEGPGFLQLWELSSKITYKYSVIHHGHTALDMKFFPTKSSEILGTLAVCLANGDLCIYNLPLLSCDLLNLQAFETFCLPGLIFSCVAWLHDCELATGTQDGSIFIFRPGFKAHIKLFGAHRLPITSITYCQAAKTIATTGLDGYLKVWDLQGKHVDSVCLSKRWSYHVCNNPLGKYLFYDNDAAVSPHKIVQFQDGKLENKKQLSKSTEATMSSCFSPISSFAYIVTAEGFIEAIYVSELEKNSKKRKTPWSRYRKIVYVEKGKIFTGESIPETQGVSCGTIKSIDYVVLKNNQEAVAWTGEHCGVHIANFDVFTS